MIGLRSGFTILFCLIAAGPLGAAVSCTLSVPSPSAVRAEGFTERVSDVLITCTGGTPVNLGSPLPRMNLQLFTQKSITSRLISAAGQQGSEVLLLLDEPSTAPQGGSPFGASAPFNLCPTPLGGCVEYASSVGGKPVPTDTPQGQNATVNGANVFQGSVNGNFVTFSGIPMLNALDGLTHRYRITNLRVDSNSLGPGVSVEFVINFSDNSIQLDSSMVSAATVAAGLAASAASPATLSPCVTQTLTPIGTMTFTELFGNAFKTRVDAQDNTQYAGQSVGAQQNVPGTVYNSESGLVVPINNSVAAGLADYGTRLKATFSNVPPGMRLFVSTTNVVNPGVATPSPAVVGGKSGNQGNAGFAQLIDHETVNDGGGNLALFPSLFQTAQVGTVGVSEILVAPNGSGTAVWEVVNANPSALETMRFAVYASYTGGSAGLAGGTVNVSLGFAPTPSGGAFTAASGSVASPDLTISRFADAANSSSLASFQSSCGPGFTSTAIMQNGSVGALYNQTLAVSGGAAPYTFAVTGGTLPPGLALSGNALSGTPQTAGDYSFSISVTDSAGVKGIGSFSLHVNAATPCPVFGVAANSSTPAVAGDFQAGVALTIGATGQVSLAQDDPYTTEANGVITRPPSAGTNAFAYFSGLAPAGPPVVGGKKTLNGFPAGALLGVFGAMGAASPPANGTPFLVGSLFSATVPNIGGGGARLFLIVNDANYADNSGSFSATTANGACVAQQAIQLSAGALGNFNFQIGGVAPPSQQIGLSASSGNAPALANFVIELPAEKWVTVTPATGLAPNTLTVSVDPTGLTAGTYKSTVNVRSPDTPLPLALNVMLTVTTAVPSNVTLACDPDPGMRLLDAYSVGCQASGGTAPFQWAITQGTLPPGFSLSANTGAQINIAGMPAALSPYSFTITVTDSSGKTASQSFSGTVQAALVTQLSGSARTIAVGANGALYITGTTGCDANGCPPYKYDGAVFQQIAGSGSRMAVDSAGRLLLLNLNGGLFRYESADSQTSDQIADSTVDVAAGGNASLYIVKTDSFAYQYNGATFSPMPVPGVRVAADNNGKLWVVEQSGLIRRAQSAALNTGFDILPGSASAIAASADGAVYIVSTSSCDGNGCTVAKFDGAQFVPITGLTAVEIAADMNNVLWLVTKGGNIQRYPAIATLPPAPSVSCLPAAGPQTAGTPYVSNCTASGGATPYQWSIGTGTLPSGLALSAPTGVSVSVTGTPTVSGNYDYTVTVTDSLQRSVGQRFTGTILNPPTQLTIACSSSAGPTSPGVSYSATCSASGGTAPYKWTVGSGSLPPGISLSNTNTQTVTIAGTPSASGAYQFTINATDSGTPPQTASQQFQGAVTNALTVTCNLSGPEPVGVVYAGTCTATGGTAPYKWAISAGSLPAGISLSNTNSQTVTISGTPSAAGAYQFAISATDSSTPPQTASQQIQGAVTNLLTVTCNLSAGPGPVGVAYSGTCTASGGTAPYKWAISSGNLPAGISLSNTNNATVTISGTPATSGAYQFIVTASDSGTPPQTASQQIQGTVAATLSVACTPSTGPVAANVSYSTTCTATGGASPIAWKLTGVIPGGLSLGAASGASTTVTGRPSTGAYNFSVVATDNGGQTASANFSGLVAAALSISCTFAPASTGVAYNGGCAALGGIPPYQWSVTSGALPAGMTLTSSTATTSTISGIPAVGNYKFTLTVTDSATPPNSVSQQFSGTVSKGIVISCTPTYGPAIVGVPYTVDCTIAGGTAPYAWLFVGSGSVPGMSFSSNGATAHWSGTPTTASDSYGVTFSVVDSSVPQLSNGLTISGTLTQPLTLACAPSAGPSSVGLGYYTMCTATGGYPGYKWGIGSGSLPAGLAFTSSGNFSQTATITGTPTAAGSYSFTVSLTDSGFPGQNATSNFSGTLTEIGFRTFNAASAKEGVLAADAIGELYGVNLAPQTATYTGAPVTTLGGASVTVTDSQGTARPAQLFYAGPSQINFLTPAGTANGAITITVARSGSSNLTGRASAAAISPGIFMAPFFNILNGFYLRHSQSGSAPDILDYTFNSQTNDYTTIPRVAGEDLYLLLYGTGFRHYSKTVTATANGQNVPVLGAVAQGQFAGLDQVNIGPLPASLPSGVITVTLTFDGVAANDVSVKLQ